MPPLEETGFEETLLLWEPGATDRYGQNTVSAVPVEVPCTWNDSRSQPNDPKKDDDSVVGTFTCDRLILLGSLVWLGARADLAGTGSMPEGELCEVTKRDKVSSLCGRVLSYQYTASRFNDRIPYA